MTRDELLQALRRPDAYRIRPAEVTHLETHISDLFFAGDRVYKVKKPVAFGFLDFSRLEQRKHFCEEEVRLNQRLAPRVYLGVVPIVRGSDGRGGARPVVEVGGAGEAVEYAVEMRRLPAQRMLDELLARGEIDNRLLDGIADLLVRFHALADTGPGVDGFGTRAAIARNALENFDETRAFVASVDGPPQDLPCVFTPRAHAFLRERTETFLNEHAAKFDARVRDGRIRDGHGDLHAGNICLAPGGVVAYDCIEFSPRLRCGDVACDLAFLAMDLDLRCFRAFSDYLVYRYSHAAEDPGVGELNRFYKSYRAMVRAKVGALRAQGCTDPADREQARREAMRYVHLAATYWLPPVLILMCGLPASGKSFAAHAVGRAFEAVVLRSDVIRKQGASREAAADGAAVSYSRTAKEQVYQRMFELARVAAAQGRAAVVLDASFGRRGDRDAASALAHDLGYRLVVVETTAARATIEARMRARASAVDEASDADLAVHDTLARSFEAPDEIVAERRAVVTEGLAPEEIVARVIDACV
ncbi:MAG: AAA family ATPase [Planctomycetota bacterium]